MKEFSRESLAEYDGKDEKPVYIVHKGRVFDVSRSKLWKGGLHMRRHSAGKDLTVDIEAAPHGLEVLDRYPQIGVIKESEARDASLPGGFLGMLLSRFPILRRHPHPMTVHFPIAFMLSVPVFNTLYLLTGHKALEATAFHCLCAGMLFTPPVILTGLFTWWLNYLARPLRAVNIKIALSLIMLVTCLIAFALRAAEPAILHSFTVSGIAYFLLTFSIAPMVSVIGQNGAKLTFPVEKE